MTLAQKKKRFRQMLRQQARMEEKWLPRIMAAISQQIEPFVDYLLIMGRVPALALIDSLVSPEPMRQVLSKLYRSVGVKAANEEWRFYLDSFPEEMRQGKAFGFNRVWASLMDAIFGRIGAEKVQRITDTEKRRLRAILQNSANENLTNYDLAKLLRSSDINLSRGWLITRTETGTAQAEGSAIAAKQTGLQLNKTWLSVQRWSTRRLPEDQFDHWNMNNVTIPDHDQFLVMGKNGAELMLYPHDPKGSAGNICNCLCVVIREPLKTRRT